MNYIISFYIVIGPVPAQLYRQYKDEETFVFRSIAYLDEMSRKKRKKRTQGNNGPISCCAFWKGFIYIKVCIVKDI